MLNAMKPIHGNGRAGAATDFHRSRLKTILIVALPPLAMLMGAAVAAIRYGAL